MKNKQVTTILTGTIRILPDDLFHMFPLLPQSIKRLSLRLTVQEVFSCKYKSTWKWQSQFPWLIRKRRPVERARYEYSIQLPDFSQDDTYYVGFDPFFNAAEETKHVVTACIEHALRDMEGYARAYVRAKLKEKLIDYLRDNLNDHEYKLV